MIDSTVIEGVRLAEIWIEMLQSRFAELVFGLNRGINTSGPNLWQET